MNLFLFFFVKQEFRPYIVIENKIEVKSPKEKKNGKEEKDFEE